MKKIIAFLMVLVMSVSFFACSNGNGDDDSADTTAAPIDVDVDFDNNIFAINGKAEKVADYTEIENDFVSNFSKDSVVIYNSQDLTAEILENRAGTGKTVVERVIGMVTNEDRKGDGVVLNTTNTEYNYISYMDVDFETRNGTIILTYLVFNPNSNYIDDVIERYDFLLDRQYEY